MRRRGIGCAAAAVALVMALAACGGDSESASEDDAPPVTETAFNACAPKIEQTLKDQKVRPELANADSVMQLGDDGRTVTVSNSQDEITLELATVFATTCLLGELDAPDSVVSEVEQTTGMDGRQSTEWGEGEDAVSLKWSYMSGTGVSAVFTTK